MLKLNEWMELFTFNVNFNLSIYASFTQAIKENIFKMSLCGDILAELLQTLSHHELIKNKPFS